MISAITPDDITDNGTAISTGRKRRNKGTAINDSPKPSVDRTKEAMKLMIRINKIVNVETYFGFLKNPEFTKDGWLAACK